MVGQTSGLFLWATAMGSITKTKTWADEDTVNYTDINANFDTLYNEINGNLDNANIDASAAIDASKISGTAVTLTATQTLTNKTLTSPSIGGTVAGSATYTKPTLNGSVHAYTTDTDDTTVTFDMAASNIHTVTLGGNRTLAVSNVSTGQSFVVLLKQDATGSRTVTWWSGIKWVNATAPTLTTTASRWDIFAFIYDGTNYYGSIVGQNFG